MKRQVTEFYCDKCGKKFDEKLMSELRFETKKAGDDETDSLDLCKGCLLLLCQNMISSLPKDAQKELKTAYHQAQGKF